VFGCEATGHCEGAEVAVRWWGWRLVVERFLKLEDLSSFKTRCGGARDYTGLRGLMAGFFAV